MNKTCSALLCGIVIVVLVVILLVCIKPCKSQFALAAPPPLDSNTFVISWTEKVGGTHPGTYPFSINVTINPASSGSGGVVTVHQGTYGSSGTRKGCVGCVNGALIVGTKFTLPGTKDDHQLYTYNPGNSKAVITCANYRPGTGSNACWCSWITAFGVNSLNGADVTKGAIYITAAGPDGDNCSGVQDGWHFFCKTNDKWGLCSN